jgi:5-methyltetrahydrofolate--homocysteine methyltransferase
MDWGKFIVVGENIHCTRIVKREGTRTTTLADGRTGVVFGNQAMPVPGAWQTVSPAYAQGNIKHAALAIWQMRNGQGEDRLLGEKYLLWMAERQVRSGAHFLDVNVDEYSTDPAEAAAVMAFVVDFLGRHFDTPLSIDSSTPNVLRVGLQHCRRDIREPMLNSVSLERPAVADIAAEFKANVIVNAAGEAGMPADAEERLGNLRRIIAILHQLGVPAEKMHLDPLVLPISTDPANGQHFLEATRRARAEFPGVHLSGGLSNISFGMPNRKLLNMVFALICTEAGTDGGIIDPVSMSPKALSEQDPTSEPFRLAKAVLTGEDMFGMEYITAHREGKLE